MQTFAAPSKAVVGETVTVDCVVSQGRQHLPGVATVVSIVPSPASAQATQSGATFVPALAGPHQVYCQTADQSVSDVQGVTVEVAAGPPATIETTLAAPVAEAGAPVGVACDLYDAYGNLLEPEDLAGNLAVNAAQEIWVDPPSGAGFVVRGTLIGDYTIGCAFGDVVDETPESLTITPGIPADSIAIVQATELGPTEPTSVQCLVTDAFGNSLEGYDTEVSVLAEDGTMPGTNGLVLTGDQLSATRAGTYYVSCRVPGFFAADESPAEVLVHPGPPHHWVVELPGYAAGDCFWQNRPLPMLAMVFDAWDNEIDPDSYELAVTSVPAGAIILNGSIIISGEGDFDLEVCVVGHCQPAGNIPPFSFPDIRLDSTPPSINLTAPVRAAMMTSITNITGQAIDGISALTALEINDTIISVTPGAESQSILLPANPQWGLNIVTGEAVDECGNRRVLAQSYLYSPQYYPASTTSNAGSRAGTGLLAHLNQPVIDDDNRNDLDDIASIAEEVLLGLNFNTLVPPGTVFVQDPLRSGCSFCSWWADYGYWVRRHSSTSPSFAIGWDGPWVIYLDAIDNALALRARLENFDFPLQANGSLRECACGVQATQSTGTISAWAGADVVQATGDLGVTTVGTDIQVTVNSMDLQTTGLYLDLDCGWADFLCDLITDFVVPLLADLIENALEDVISAEIPPLIDDFLSSFGIDTGFNLPAPLSLHLNLSSGLDLLDFDGPAGTGNGELGLYAQVYPSARGSTIPAGSAHPGCCGSRGAIRRNAPQTAPTFSSIQYSFGLGLKDDVLNQVLWAAWYGGGLNLTLGEILSLAGDFNLDGVTMTIDGKLPPVIMPGTNPNQVYIGLGDAKVDATVNLAQLLGAEAEGVPPLTVGMYLSAVVGGSLDIDPTTNEIQIFLDTDNPSIYVQVTSIDDEGYQGVMTDLFTGLLELLLPELLSRALGSFPIPEFNLSALGVPIPDTILTLSNGDLGRPNTSNQCIASGSPSWGASHFCLTGSLK